MTTITEAQQSSGFGVDGNAVATRCAIDRRRHAIVAIAREFLLDPDDVGDRRLRRTVCLEASVGPQLELMMRRHRAKRVAIRRSFASRWRRQKRFSIPNSIHRAEKGKRSRLPPPPMRQSERWR